MGQVKVYAALPTYDGTRRNGLALLDFIQCGMPVYIAELTCSALAYSFNRLWADALNMRPEVTHFLMLHADVVPLAPFTRELVDEMESVGADVLSVVIPIKTDRGLTSTAWERADKWNPRRVTMLEAFARPETWHDEGLLLNTGLMLVDLRKPWVEQVHFETGDDVVMGADGKWRAVVEPEDWRFSRRARELGAILYATRKVPVVHWGAAEYGNDIPWGEEGPDPGGAA